MLIVEYVNVGKENYVYLKECKKGVKKFNEKIKRMKVKNRRGNSVTS